MKDWISEVFRFKTIAVQGTITERFELTRDATS